MLKNYFKVAIRSFWRDKTFSVINLVGLAIGLAAVVIIIAYVKYEFSYDRHYSNASNVYRIENRMGSNQELFSVVQNGVGATLQKEFPEISANTYADKMTDQFKSDNGLLEITMIRGSVDFFKVFNFPFISGDRYTPLSEAHTIVLTEKTARKFFPGKNAVGRIMTVAWGRQYKVTAVIKDIPGNTHLQFDAVVSLVGHPITKDLISFKGGGVYLPQYILLNKGADATALTRKFSSIYQKYGLPPDNALELLNVTKIHLYSHTYDEIEPGGDIRYIYLFLLAGLFILTIAVINYINLATARSVKRMPEIGMRKVLGAGKRQLVFQFIAESFIFFLIALTLGLLLAKVCWPFFEKKIANGNNLISLYSISSIYIITGITIIGGFLAGVFPAFFLARVKPALSLKGVLKYNINISFRKVLVVIQFVISGVLVIATLVVQKQLHFISNSKLGFNKEQLITLPFDGTWHHNIGAFKDDLKRNPAIKGISVSRIDVGKNFHDLSKMITPEKIDTSKQAGLQFIENDPDFIKTMQIEMLAGRDFSERFGNDNIVTDTFTQDFKKPHKYDRLFAAKSIIINETAIKQLGLQPPIIGQQLIYKNQSRGTVIGIVKDFNIASLYQKIPGMVIRSYPDLGTGKIYIRIAPQNIPQTLSFIGNQWKKYYPDELYNFSFVDDKLQKLYITEQTLGALFGVFAFTAIMIACFGLFGLVSLSVQQRVREIGIRKVFGASVKSIVSLLSADFLKLVIVAIAIASPIAWWGMNKWLQNFAYRIEISWWLFIAAAVLAVLTAFLTMSFQTIKAAAANPVKSLRNE